MIQSEWAQSYLGLGPFLPTRWQLLIGLLTLFGGIRGATGGFCLGLFLTAGARRGGLRVTARLPNAYFDRMYAGEEDPWELSIGLHEKRK